MTEQNSEEKRCGFVAVIGAPNAGKSTLVNKIVGSKVSIVSPKVQTTRSRVLGIAIRDNTQLILVDTPGLFQPKSRLDRAMVSAAWMGAEEADVVLYLFDAQKSKPNAEDLKTLERVKQNADGRKIILGLNKVDAIDPPKLLALSGVLNGLCPFEATFMISALKGSGVEDLAEYLCRLMPQAPFLFDEDQISDMPMRLLAAEVTREQVFNQLHQELPYSITVETETWENFENGDVRLQQAIHVERDSQKAIVLGKGGARLKEIGSRARAELETMLENKVHLKLFVRVSDNWHDNPEYYAQWGLDSGA
jgi:GTP-binding protein Era